LRDHIEALVIIFTANLGVILSAEVDACVLEALAIESYDEDLRAAPDSIDYRRGKRSTNLSVLKVDLSIVQCPASIFASIDELEERIAINRCCDGVDAGPLPFERLLVLLVDMVVDSGSDLVDVV
jgi:hypothetical protein